MVTEVKHKPVNVEEEINAVNRSHMRENANATGTMMITLGIFEMLFGVVAIAASSFTGVAFVVLAGVAILVSGVFEFVSAFARNNLSRFAWGILSIIAGAVIASQPAIGLNILGAIAAVYLIATGIARLFGTENRLWARIGGIIGILLGIAVFAQLPAISAFLIGLFVGIHILINGAIAINIGTGLKSMAK